MDNGLVEVMLAVRDKRGNLSGAVDEFQISDLIKISGGGELFSLGENRLAVCTKLFPYKNYTTHVGNIMWDCAWMLPSVAAELINWLRQRSSWTCEEAEARLWEKWHNHEPFDEADFKSVDNLGRNEDKDKGRDNANN